MADALTSDRQVADAGSLVIRPFQESDRALVMDAWLRDFRDSPMARGVECDDRGFSVQRVTVTGARAPEVRHAQSIGLTDTVYFYEQRRLVESLLRCCDVTVMCDPQDRDLVLGWACTSTQDGVPVVHYVHVVHDFRRMGVARSLLASRGIGKGTMCFFTHAPGPEFAFGKAKGRWRMAWLRDSRWVHDPFVAFYQAAKEQMHGKEREEAGSTASPGAGA